jgi:hypothetical protein
MHYYLHKIFILVKSGCYTLSFVGPSTIVGPIWDMTSYPMLSYTIGNMDSFIGQNQ